jgi:proton-translocating NADH-quinone oxidoreductase chain N
LFWLFWLGEYEVNVPAWTWLIVIPLVSSPVVYLMGRKGKGPDSLSRGHTAAPWIAWTALAVTLFPFFRATQELALKGPSTLAVGVITLRADGLSLLMAGTAITLAALVVLFSGPYMAGEMEEEKFYAMLMVMVGTTIGLVSAGDLFNLWVWFEAMAISSYVLVAFYREQPASLEAGVKYLVQSAAGSVLVLLGIALVLAQTGTLDLEQIRTTAKASPSLLAAGALFLTGFGVKAALVPLHTWLPDAYTQAPSGISAILSGVVTEAGLVAMLRALASLAGVSLSWGVLLMGFGAINMLVGNLMALRQQQVKRLLAYSSLTHIGYMLLGVGIGIYAGQLAGAQGGFFHLVNHGLMKELAFLAAGALLYALRTVSGDHGPLTVSDLHGAARRYPVAALALSVAVLGLGGLPPLAGFMSKWQIFVAGFMTGNAMVEGLIVFAALMSVLSMAYYAPLVNVMYRQEISQAVRAGKPLPPLMLLPLVLLALAVVVIGMWPSLLEWLTAPAGAALLAAFGR